jgi:hypothetical protein
MRKDVAVALWATRAFPTGKQLQTLGRFPPAFASFGMAGIGTVQEGAGLGSVFLCDLRVVCV